MFTSGSTGRSKAVPIYHRNLSPYLEYNIARSDDGPSIRHSQNFAFTVDAAMSDISVTRGGGGTLVVPSREEMLHPVAYARDRMLTHWHSTDFDAVVVLPETICLDHPHRRGS